MCVKTNVLNCWNVLKPYLPQRDDEISVGAMAAKAKRKIRMAYGQILNVAAMDNQHLSPDEGKVQRLF